MRRTKIVCTIGPASQSRKVLEKLIHAGMDVARLNFSHGTHEAHAKVIAELRDLSEKTGRPLAILQDLSGPKVRLGDLTAPCIAIRRGHVVGFIPVERSGSQPLADHERSECHVIPLPVPALLAAVKKGNILLIDDGKLSFKVVSCAGEPGCDDRIVWARCLVGGDVKPHKGVTAVGVTFDVPAVTEKDLDDLRFGLLQGVDWIAASYVRRASDLEPLRRLMKDMGVHVPLIAKIEKFEAVRHLEEILKAVDGIMVARGDLGVEMPFDEVPMVQKQIIRACNVMGKPVITATQMLESMILNPRPTRAEATDVTNAILDGTDAVMLSGETAAGQYPVESVQTMARIALRADDAFHKESRFAGRPNHPEDVTGAVARATADIASELKAGAILCATSSGGTARNVAQYRPRVPIVAVTTEKATYRQLALTWGVHSLMIEPVNNFDAMMDSTINAARSAKIVKDGDRVVVTAGVPVNNPGTTNLIKVHTVGQPLDPGPPQS